MPTMGMGPAGYSSGPVPIVPASPQYPGGTFETADLSSSPAPFGAFSEPPAVRSTVAPFVNLLADRNIMPTAPVRPPRPPLPEPQRSSNVNTKVMRSTLNAVPETAALLQQTKLPFGIHIFPFGSDSVPVIETTVITRCRVCRTYINPFVTFLAQGKRWRCNMCQRVHDLPADFDYDPVLRQHIERADRPELTSATVEYIAPSEYMVRAPQPCVYLFLIDVSYSAVSSGMLQTVCNTILSNIDDITGDSRTKVGFITYDHTVQFYQLNPESSQPKMMVMTDVEDVFIPSPTDLIVNLQESKDIVKQLLTSLPNMFANSTSTFSCLGPALLAAKEMLSTVGGRITVFQATMPNLGQGALKQREDLTVRGTPKELALLQPLTDFYKQTSVDCSRAQIAIDMFLCASQYIDLATLSQAPKFSAGSLFYYPNFNRGKNGDGGEKLEKDLSHYLTRQIGLEAVMRVRCSKGLAMHTFHGNFFVRSQDLLALPNVSPDNGYAFQVSIEESLADQAPFVYFQAALLYTSSSGDRRIRVHTMGLPITKDVSAVFTHADQVAICSLLAKMAVDRALASKLTDAREALINFAVDSLAAYRKTFGTNAPDKGQLIAPDSLKLIPAIINGLLKHPAFRNNGVSLDERAYAMLLFKVLPLWETAEYMYPRMYSLHDMADYVCKKDEKNRLPMPPIVHLTSEKMSRGGVYFINTGQEMFMWVSRSVPIQFCNDVFGLSHYDAIPDDLMTIPKLDNELNQKIRNLVSGLRNCHSRFMPLHIIKEDSKRRGEFLQLLADDRTDSSMSYYEFLNYVCAEVAKL